MIRFATSTRFALIMAACLTAVIVWDLQARVSCCVAHRVEVDGRVYEGGCTAAEVCPWELAVMGLAPLSAVLAMFRPGSSLRRLLGMVALIALELTAISWTPPARAFTQPYLVQVDPKSGHQTIILAR